MTEGPSEPQPLGDEPGWIGDALAAIDAALRANPPAFPTPPARQEALMALDGPTHWVHANRFESVRRFYLDRIARAIDEIEQTAVTQGARLWRLYNCGFVIRTPTVTIGCDVVRGWDETETSPACRIDDALAERLAAQLDLLTISHGHADHVDEGMRDLLGTRGVPILVPPGVYADRVDNEHILCPQRAGTRGAPADVHRLRPLELADGREIRINPYPGHQGELPNNMILCQTGDGFTFLHTGDQSGDADWDWIDQIGRQHEVDVLLINAWTNEPWRLIEGVAPKCIVSSHELEMTHTPNHREPHWASFRVFGAHEDRPAHSLAWGDAVDYMPSD